MDVTKFEELQLDDRIIRAITEMGFEESFSNSGPGDSCCIRRQRYDRSGSDRNRKDSCFRTSSVAEG